MLFSSALYNSPIGTLSLVWQGNDLYFLGFGESLESAKKRIVKFYKNFEILESKLPINFETALNDYFNGSRTSFEGLSLKPLGTEFQKNAWEVLKTIPYGKTISYGEEAKAMNTKGFQAVGMANNQNPIAIIIPCHRVIGKDGSMVGYGGGLRIKEFLLNLEKANI